MLPRRSFERRLRTALVLFAVLPMLVLMAGGSYLVGRAVALTDSVRAWERVAGSGRELLRGSEVTGDPELVAAARAHRRELSDSVVQARRWEFLLGRAVVLIPLAALVLGGVLFWLAVRASRRMARGLSRPVDELVGWAGRVGRGEALPARGDGGSDPADDDFAVLRDAFRTMTAELESSRARAVEAERLKTWVTMARHVAHELKNPLTPMTFALRTLQRRDDANAADREALEVISTETARLEELARSFAEFGRLPEAPASEIDLREMLAYLLQTHVPAEANPRLRAPVDLPMIHGHHDALARAFANLILNAGEAVADGSGSVSVVMRAVGGAVEVRVLDGGAGIPPENLERIWEPDFTTKTRGTGLGLALVRQTVHAHGGLVSARNRGEGGAEFRVVLPTAAPKATAPNETSVASIA